MGTIFMGCSYWIYQNADLEFDEVLIQEDEDSDWAIREAQMSDIQPPPEASTGNQVSWKAPQSEPLESFKKQMNIENNDKGKGTGQ